MNRPVVAIMARAPSSEGKSRLIADLGTDDGPGLRLALLRDTLASVSAIAAEKAVLYTPPDGEDEIRAVTPFDAIFLPQRGSTLGERMREGAHDLLAAGFDAVVLIGSDLPTLPPAHIHAALDILARRGEVLVLGPAEDGGYYLIGLTRSRPEFFEHIPWSSPLVLQRTRDAAEALGIPVETIPLWYDIDSVSDLRRVWRCSQQPGGAPRYIRAWLAAAPLAVRLRVDGETIKTREGVMVQTVHKPSISWVVMLGAGLAVASALVLLAAPVGYRLGMLPLRVALQTFLRWGAYGGIAAAVVSLAGLVVTLMRPRQARRGLLLATVSLLVGLALVGIPGRFRVGPPKPPIHDITTDTREPPEYVAVLPLRASAPNTTVYGGEKIAVQQRAAYPDLQPLMLNVPPPQAFDRALAAVRDMGWDLVAADAAAGRIEATDTTFWFGFKDDVVIRIRPAEGGSRVDVRSVSRVGGGDAGTNAKRIRAYLDALRS